MGPAKNTLCGFVFSRLAVVVGFGGLLLKQETRSSILGFTHASSFLISYTSTVLAANLHNVLGDAAAVL